MEFIIIIIILALILTIFFNWQEKRKERKLIQNKLDIIPDIKIDFENLKLEDYQKMDAQEQRRIYLQLIDIENKIDKTERHLDDIKFCVQLMVVFIVLPIILKLSA